MAAPLIKTTTVSGTLSTSLQRNRGAASLALTYLVTGELPVPALITFLIIGYRLFEPIKTKQLRH